VPPNRLPLRPPDQYRELGIELQLGESVGDLGLDRHSVELESGKAAGWDLLCIATGSGARRLPGYEGAHHLRELHESEALRELIDRSGPLNIVGAGFVGCEVAAVATEKGCEVHVYEALEQPLLRVLGPELGAYLAQHHRDRGVDLHLNVKTMPELDDPILVAVGSAPRTELAERAGLEVARGVVVDEYGRTSTPGVFAAGDVTRFFSPRFATRIRVEHFQTAQRQGFAVGRAMAGAAQPYNEVPWFWSDQYELNLQYAGAGLPWEQIVIRGALGSPPFTVFYLQSGRLIAAAGVNDHHTVARARHLMERGAEVSQAQLADPSFDLRQAGRP
jgi:3-phenylpropionate/trans-cinnamate dioxygenase ferredoxin reductase subunit